ncbi:LAGLIDADG family homing endonuclease [Streptomyces sp. NPDC048362]|uniref:LAGLIDADG family homing endonuclease n=1 Tax=Streptomyces sp. NPDC048362 TaxID=3365539 RepID=UPI00372272FE
MDLAVPEYAYMFGFLQADGHLARGTGRKGRLSVEISARDIELLRSFQELTPYYSSVTERTRSTNFSDIHTSAIWTLCSLDARTKIYELGLPYGRKSRSIAPPDIRFSRRDYLRGLIDADGSVGYTSKGVPFVALTSASSAIAFCLRDYARDVTRAERILNRSTRDGVYNVLYTMEVAQRLAADLYYPNCLALGRKRAAAESLATWGRPPGMRSAHTRRRWTEDEDRILLSLSSSTAAAEVLGRTNQSCDLRLWRLRTGQVPTPTDR